MYLPESPDWEVLLFGDLSDDEVIYFDESFVDDNPLQQLPTEEEMMVALSKQSKPAEAMPHQADFLRVEKDVDLNRRIPDVLEESVLNLRFRDAARKQLWPPSKVQQAAATASTVEDLIGLNKSTSQAHQAGAPDLLTPEKKAS